MADGDIETYRVPGGWANRIQGVHKSQIEAVQIGQAIASRLRVEWFLRSLKGRWRLRNTYGKDPHPPKG